VFEAELCAIENAMKQMIYRPNINKKKIVVLVDSKLHNLYSSPNIIRMIKSRSMRWAGHVARMGRRGMHIGYWWESQKERDH
jgi:ribosomal protein L28